MGNMCFRIDALPHLNGVPQSHGVAALRDAVLRHHPGPLRHARRLLPARPARQRHGGELPLVVGRQDGRARHHAGPGRVGAQARPPADAPVHQRGHPPRFRRYGSAGLGTSFMLSGEMS